MHLLDPPIPMRLPYAPKGMNLDDLAAPIRQQQRSTPDLIAEALRQAIQRGILPAGQSLRQDEIATQFGVSRIPVREALRQLEVEGLVVFHSNRGAIVTTLTATEVEEIGEIRIALETTALRLAIPHLSSRDFERATACLKAIETIETTDDPVQAADLNWQFHTTLYTPAQRPRLLGMIKTLHINIDRYGQVQRQSLHDRERSLQEHHQLLAACRQPEIATAVEILQHHIHQETEQLSHYLRGQALAGSKA